MIGLDGATFDLLDPLVEQGVMPFMGSVLKRAVRADLMSTRHPLTPQAWTSMITGRSPEAHGVYDFLRPAFLPDGSIFLKLNDYRDNHCETIWSIANRHKQRIPNRFMTRCAPCRTSTIAISVWIIPRKRNACRAFIKASTNRGLNCR